MVQEEQSLSSNSARHYAPAPCPAETEPRPRLAVGIPTSSRPGIIFETVCHLARQTRLPDLVLISVADIAHAGGIEKAELPFPVEVLVGAPGLSRQRNLILNALRYSDIVMFLDDDFLMTPDYLERTEKVFADNPDVVMTTGKVIADGILGPGLNHAEGDALLAEAADEPVSDAMVDTDTGYGCNTAVRLSTVIDNNLHFDEHLPLYSWLEDVDFSARLNAFGRIVRVEATRGVHLGTKTGRTPGMNLGYSQIANPVYLVRKGTLAWPRARNLMMRNVASNLAGTLRPRPRPGRITVAG